MIWPIRCKPLLDPDTAAWHTENLAWVVRQFGGGAALAEATLVLPKLGFFVFDGEQGHALALRIFEQVKAYCGMSDWEVDLIPDDNPLADVREFAPGVVVPTKVALGTFAAAGNRIQISYATAQLRRPDRLIATLAHELAHCLLATAAEPPPCEDDEVECLTDLTAVYLGFGVFLANARFEFDASDQGWRWQRAGYLPEADLIFALALFLHAKRLEADAACTSLKPHLTKMLKRALRDVEQTGACIAPADTPLRRAVEPA